MLASSADLRECAVHRILLESVFSLIIQMTRECARIGQSMNCPSVSFFSTKGAISTPRSRSKRRH